MDKEIQERILDALNKLIDGAPEMWMMLCNEVVTRGYVHMAILATIGLVALVCGWSCIFIGKRANWDSGKDDDIARCFSSLICGGVSILTIIFVLYNMYNAIGEIVAPALFLLGR